VVVRERALRQCGVEQMPDSEPSTFQLVQAPRDLRLERVPSEGRIEGGQDAGPGPSLVADRQVEADVENSLVLSCCHSLSGSSGRAFVLGGNARCRALDGDFADDVGKVTHLEGDAYRP
jgi:hypothetical protein